MWVGIQFFGQTVSPHRRRPIACRRCKFAHLDTVEISNAPQELVECSILAFFKCSPVTTPDFSSVTFMSQNSPRQLLSMPCAHSVQYPPLKRATLPASNEMGIVTPINLLFSLPRMILRSLSTAQHPPPSSLSLAPLMQRVLHPQL